MLKYLMALTMLTSTANVSYVNVDSIEYYQQKEDIKKIVFNFNSDYFSTHIVEVRLDFYDINDKYIQGYSNELKIIGDKQAIANIMYSYNEDSYAFIDIVFNGNILVNDAKINFYVQDDCLLDIDNRECNRIYKSYYKNRISKDEIFYFRINESNFSKYLYNNNLKVENFLYYSNCDLKDSTAYLYLYNKIDEYNLLYDDKYSFLLGINDDNKLEFVDHYFVNLLEFEFFESHSKDTIKVNSLYFPYSSEYIEYDLSIVIEAFISVKVEFSVFTKGDLLGECETSKYCLRYESD